MNLLKLLLTLSLLFSCVGCDIPDAFFINNTRKYFVSNNCGDIKIICYSFNSRQSIVFTFYGEFIVSLDSLLVVSANDKINNVDVGFKLLPVKVGFFHQEPKELDKAATKKLYVKNGDILYVGLYERKELYILPSNFIECNGEPIITDTLKILHSGRKVYRGEW